MTIQNICKYPSLRFCTKKSICFYIDLTCVKVSIREEFATVYLPVTVIDRTEVTVCG